MKEYGNYYSREDVPIPPANHFIGAAIEKAKDEKDVNKKHAVLKSCVKALAHEAKRRNEMNIGFEIISQNMYILYVCFNYNGGIYYWWELFKHSNFSIVKERIKRLDESYGDGLDTVWSVGELYDMANFVKSSLEIQIRKDPLVTYVWFATDEKQSPLMCTEHFKNKVDISKKY